MYFIYWIIYLEHADNNIPLVYKDDIVYSYYVSDSASKFRLIFISFNLDVLRKPNITMALR